VLVTIPVEIKRRELVGKSWLAYNLLLKGHAVVIGPPYEILTHLRRLQPAIHIEHNRIGKHAQTLEDRNTTGTKSISLPTEGAVTSKGLYHPDTAEFLQHVHAFLAWGPAQASELREQTPYPERVIAAGNPRFDIHNSRFRSVYDTLGKSKRDDMGRYVLINTNFTRANHVWPGALHKFGQGIDPDRVDIEQLLISGMCEAAQTIAEQTELQVILRPHPNEARDVYDAVAARHEQIAVDDSGDVFAWICGASCVIHNSCTTGVQAAMVDTPVIAYTPPGSEHFEVEIANAVSRRATTPEKVVRLVQEVLVGKWTPVVGVEDRLKQEFANLERDAAPFIAELVDEISPRPVVDYTGVNVPLWGRLKTWGKASPLLRRLVEPAAEVVAHPRLLAITYGYQKFPGLRAEELVTLLDGFAQSDPLEYHIESVPRCRNSFVITPT